MKKIFNYLVSFLAISLALVACKKEEPTPDPTPVGGGFKINEVVAAASEAYSTWEDAREIPASFTVAGKTLSASDFFFVEATALVEISEGSQAEIAVVPYKAAASPDKDSYDATEIAVTNGPKDGKGVAEDIVTVAKTFLADAAAKGQWQNRVLVYRGDDALAFCTNRAIVTVMRALAAYAESAKLPATVSTEYLSASNTLKAFAQEFVKYLDIWDATIADKLSADGDHCSANNNAWERVHFIPIPYDTDNDYHNEGKDQYDFAKYGNPQNIEVNGETYTAANCWEIAIRGLMDMCTTDGQAFMNTMDRNTPINYGDGLSLMSAPISKPSETCIWGKYPWYEKEGDGGFIKYNEAPITEMNVDLLLKACSWHVTRSFIKNNFNDPLGMIGNFQQFGTSASTLNVEGYEGLISPMREFLIMARIYKYLLDNNINKNVYTAIKDVKFDVDLYNQELPVNVKTKSLKFEATPEGPLTIELTATENWTATCDAEWLSLDKTSGAAGDAKVTVTAQNNTGEARTATITFAAGDYTKDVAVIQTEYIAPITGTLKEFAQEFVKALDEWNSHVGRVDADGAHNLATGWQNAHFVPIEHPNATGKDTYVGEGFEGNQYDETLFDHTFTVNVNGQVYTSAQAWDIAIRGLMDLVTAEGSAELENFTDSRNHAMTFADGASLLETMPTPTAGCAWGKYPWYEQDNQMTNNGQPVTEVGVDFMVKACSWHLIRAFIKIPGVNGSPLGMIGNYQEFGTNPDSQLVLDNYAGYIAPMREFLILARFYKYLLDNNITENVYTAVKDQKFDYDLYNQGAVPVKETTIKDFATEYVKLLDVWEKTTGKINTITGFDTASSNYDPANDVIGHYIPEDTKITVGKKEYNLADVYELAERSYLLVRGYDGNDVNPDHVGAGKIDKLDKSVNMSETAIPATHDYQWASLRYNESAGNGGNFQKKDGSAVASLAVLDNNANRSINWPLNPSKGNGLISNNCGYNSDQVPGFKGCFSAVRAMLTYAEFFKYMLDNNLDTAGELSADTEVPTRLFGETKPVPAAATLKDFAEAYVSCLDVWKSTVGMVEADGTHCVGKGTQFENVHLVPIANPNKGYTTEGNQYDDTLYPVKWTVKVGETEYTSAQAWEIAIRGLMELCTTEGEAFLAGMTDRNMAYTLANGKALSTTVPDYTDVCEWGAYPWYEQDADNKPVTFNDAEIDKVGIDFILKCGSWFVVRGLITNSGNTRLGKIGNYQEFGTKSSTLILDGYKGFISPMRVMLLTARVYKYLLDNNITENAYDALKDVKVDFDLY
ncbi:MAG: BACON domain-containing protein [Bacteroidales bacterium]|nr:BACON domain-containing protein [Candidatus Cryptobacteroides fimicaballi]